MSNDSSLSGGETDFAFDLDSPKGVTHLLASIRASDVLPDQKNELRDLIFSYTSGGQDQSVRISLEQKITAYHVVPVAVLVSDALPTPPKHTIGSSRLSPSFAPSVIPPAPAPVQPVTEVSVPTPSVPVTPAPDVQPLPEIPAQPVPANVPVPTPTAPPLPVKPVLDTPVATPPTTPPASNPPVPTSMPAVPPNQVAYDSSQNLQRIREIKALVNDQVGNPVNLIDIDNEVGREYMASLLDAMKKLSSGTSNISAMKRLETAYTAVEKTLIEHKKNSKKAPPEPISEPAPVPSSVPVVKVKVAAVPEVNDLPSQSEPIVKKVAPVVNEPVKPIKVDPIPAATPVRPATIANPSWDLESSTTDKLDDAPTPSTPTPPPAPVVPQPPVAPVEKIVPISKPAPKEPVVSAPETQLPVAAKVVNKSPEVKSIVPEEVTSWGPATDTLETPEVSRPEDDKFASLAQSKDKIKTLADLPKSSALETSSIDGDPLFTKEVDAGLQQLLAEWTIFKKSGLFGTGPKGMQHPLFKKLGGLQIPLLLAGRFEGATQEIKQSITDYMNGWRYEQGIVYEQGENFEHYLRRVIRHILDLQKAKIPS